jgi:hypothetical protein
MEWFSGFLRLQPKESRRELKQVFDAAYKACNHRNPVPFI